MNNTLYIITPYFNPWRYASRKKLFFQFKEYIKKFNCELITIEVALRDRDFETAYEQPLESHFPFDKSFHNHECSNNHIMLRSKSELWHKERAINLAMNRLPIDAQYIGWLDGDVQFARDDWVEETIHRLQHYSVVQFFSESINLSPDFEIVGNKRTSFFKAYLEGYDLKNGAYAKLPHPGFGFAFRREALNDLGGMLDIAILGSGDLHMARALTGNVKEGLYDKLSPGYVEQLEMWQARADQYIRRNVGVVPGLLLHFWHGNRKDRRYNDRWKILTDHQYDPEFDIKPDSQGLWQFTNNKPELEYGIRNYFSVRHEDSIDVY